MPSLIVTGGTDGSVGIFDLEATEFKPQYIKVHTNNCSVVKFSPTNDNILLTAGLDEALNFVDLRQNKVARTLQLDVPLTALDISKDGVNIVVGSYFGDLKGIDIRKD